MQNNVKSSVTAGLLGVFLGAFGAHQWYLGETKKAITHVCLCVGGFILLIVGVILYSLMQGVPVISLLFVFLMVAAYVILVGNGIWGFVEGVILLMQGDVGLAAKGYAAADNNAMHHDVKEEVEKQPVKPPVVMEPLIKGEDKKEDELA